MFSDPYSSFDGTLSPPIFYVYQQNEENLLIKGLIFLQNAPLKFILFSSSFICVAVSDASRRDTFCENVGNICNY